MGKARKLPVILALLVALGLGMAARETASQAQQAISFDEVQIFFELNATDGDLGLQFFLDGEPWRRVLISQPNGERLIDFAATGNAGVIGLTELFSESAEPSFEDLPRDQFLARFPAGQYTFMGTAVDGRSLMGTATLTHNLPAAPNVTAPVEDAEVDPRQPLVVRWDLVPDPSGSAIEAYQVIVEKDEDDERLRVFSIDMPKTATSVTVPVEFFEPGKEFKVEVLAIETSGNKTITEVSFETA